jgi:hypothetical protein
MTAPGDPFEEGKLAALQGEAASSNPYPKDSGEHDLWEEGYIYVAESDDEGESKGNA